MENVFNQFWSWIFVAVIVYVGGVVSKTVATRYGWRGTEVAPSLYDVTLPMHPLAVAFVVGLAPWPTLHAIEDIPDLVHRLLARGAWFCLAGAMSGQIYESLKSLIGGTDDVLLGRLKRAVSTPPANPPDEV